MSTFNQLWKKLAKSKKYREEFVAAQVKRGIPFQIRTMLKQSGLPQEEIASRAGLTQGVVSRAANPEYGNLTLNTLIRIAAGFDVAFVGKFVPFSELAGWFTTLSEDSVRVKTFEEENQELGKPSNQESPAAANASSASHYNSLAGILNPAPENFMRVWEGAFAQACAEIMASTTSITGLSTLQDLANAKLVPKEEPSGEHLLNADLLPDVDATRQGLKPNIPAMSVVLAKAA